MLTLLAKMNWRTILVGSMDCIMEAPVEVCFWCVLIQCRLLSSTETQASTKYCWKSFPPWKMASG